MNTYLKLTIILLLVFSTSTLQAYADYFMATVNNECTNSIADLRKQVMEPYTLSTVNLEENDYPEKTTVINWCKPEGYMDKNNFRPPFHMTLQPYDPNSQEHQIARTSLETAITKVQFKVKEVSLYTTYFVLVLNQNYETKPGHTLSDNEKNALNKYLVSSPHVSLVRAI